MRERGARTQTGRGEIAGDTPRFHSLLLSLALTVSLLVVVGSPADVIAQTSGELTDLALVVDGSGSISSAEFDLQTLGIRSLVANRIKIPTDGSVGITVVQFASGITRIEIPYTIIDPGTDIDALLDQIEAISQIGGLTNPGDGINTAMAHFEATIPTDRINSGSSQSICLSTDGFPNSGADTQTARDNAIASSLGLDRLSIEAASLGG